MLVIRVPLPDTPSLGVDPSCLVRSAKAILFSPRPLENGKAGELRQCPPQTTPSQPAILRIAFLTTSATKPSAGPTTDLLRSSALPLSSLPQHRHSLQGQHYPQLSSE